MIIDMHTHPYEESFKKLPVRRRDELVTRLDGPREDVWEGWVEEMLALGIERAVARVRANRVTSIFEAHVRLRRRAVQRGMRGGKAKRAMANIAEDWKFGRL